MAERAADSVSSKRRARQRFHAHWSVFLPTVVIALLYGCAWIWLTVSGAGDNGLTRLSLLVLAIGVPLLFVHAGLRYMTTRIRVGESAVMVLSGWVLREPRAIRLRDLTGVTVKRGLIGRVLDTGTVIFIKRNGEQFAVPDVAQPDQVARAIFMLS